MKYGKGCIVSAILAGIVASFGSARAQSVGGQQFVVNLGQAPAQDGMDLIVNATGSGVNGPQTASSGVAITAIKKGFFTPQAGIGELDGAYIFLRQDGQTSDGSGLLINAQNTGLGFLSATEFAVSTVDVKTNTLSQAADIQTGSILPGGDTYGFVATADVGSLDTGVLVQNSGSSTWANMLLGRDNAGHPYFVVDGHGNSYQDGAMRSGSRTVSQLPENCTPGDKLNATDGRKVNEAPGDGSGVPVVCELVSRLMTQVAWYSEFSGLIVSN